MKKPRPLNYAESVSFNRLCLPERPDVKTSLQDLTLCCHLVHEDRRSKTHNAVSKYIQYNMKHDGNTKILVVLA